MICWNTICKHAYKKTNKCKWSSSGLKLILYSDYWYYSIMQFIMKYRIWYQNKSYLMFKLSYIMPVVLLQLCSQISLSLLFVICLPRIGTSFILLIIVAKPLPSMRNNQQEINKQKYAEYIYRNTHILITFILKT